MSNLPKHLYWAIEHPAERSVKALYWRKVHTLAHVFSIPVTMLNATDTPRIFKGLRLSNTKLAELHAAEKQQIQDQLDALQALFVTKYHVQASYKMITEKPFFEAAINLVKQQENTWMVAQSSAKIGIPNIVWQLLRNCPIPTYIAKEKNWRMPLNILAAIDPTHENDKQSALDHKILATAAEIANLCQAKLHIIHCYSPVILADHEIQKCLEKIYRENSHEIIDEYDIDSHNVHLIAGDPAEEIEELCQTLDIDLVIMGAVSRNSLERIFIGNTAQEVLPILEADVLLLKV
ncbi:hypothetical protein AU255_09485 [Methyloprofundus sedimenti]|uniref:UspA domain-containing protein n=1 Tax=Methyloprofundus sedimenti TaxID=1420851 RepID=A0A1V8M9U0_9GAMM|nr:universal stress protein [Methyloprofundus sedimenti]OQK18063.1 hypothetical protein AU255_09485 [Methyloprofundus sedimenti]